MNKYIRQEFINSGILLISDNPEEYTLKSGAKTNIYINLKDIIKVPHLLSAITQQLSDLIEFHFTLNEKINGYVRGMKQSEMFNTKSK